MKAVYMVAHLRAPVGLWGVVCGARIRLLRDGARVCFTHMAERRAERVVTSDDIEAGDRGGTPQVAPVEPGGTRLTASGG